MKLGIKKGNERKISGSVPQHYPADRVYLDGDTSKNVQELVARKKDLTDLNLTGTKNTTGSTIPSGYYFCLNGTLVRAKTAIANGATFTLNTNYEVVSAGGLNGQPYKIKVYEFTYSTSIPANSEVNFNLTGIPTSESVIGLSFTSAWINYELGQYLAANHYIVFKNPSNAATTVGVFKVVTYKI